MDAADPTRRPARTRAIHRLHAAFVVLVAVLAAVPAAADASAGRIINGTKADATAGTRYQSVAHLLVMGDQSYGECGATIISPAWALTAAHCVTDAGAVVGAENLYLQMGSLDVSGTRLAINSGTHPSAIPELARVTAVKVHPGFDADLMRNDVALLALASAATVPGTPIVGAGETSVWGGGSGLASGAWIMGWGRSSYTSDEIADELLQAWVPIVADADCTANFATIEEQDAFDPTTMLCAGVLDADGGADTTNGIDTCQGDSGGPLIAGSEGAWRVIGIVSFGFGCADTTYGAYTRVDAMRSWIEATLQTRSLSELTGWSSAQGTSAGRMLLSWSALDAGARLDYRATTWTPRATGGFARTQRSASFAPGARRPVITAKAGQTVCLDRAVVRNPDGSSRALAGRQCVSAPAPLAGARYTGFRLGRTQFDAQLVATRRGSTATLPTHARAIQLSYVRMPNAGAVKIYFNGRLVKQVSLAGTEAVAKATIPVSRTAVRGSVKIVTTSAALVRVIGISSLPCGSASPNPATCR
jgi:secreted trypsin-like serine protease